MPTPPTGRRPPIRCRYPERGQQLPEPGTIVETSDGAMVLYVGDHPGQIDAEQYAAKLRQALTVTLVGHRARVGQPLRHLLQECWYAADRAASQAAKPPALPKPKPGRCGRPRKDGHPCGLAAGWGSDTPGQGACSLHGGSTAKRDAAARRLSEQVQTVSRLAAQAHIAPLTVQERLTAAIALREVLAATRARQRRIRRATP